VDFESAVSELVALLRGRPLTRGSAGAVSDAHFREDAALISQHRKAFQRRAFISPCYLEVDPNELIVAIDDTIAAMNTGSLYSRSGKLLSTFPTWNEYRLPDFKAAFGRIMQLLDDLRRTVIALGKDHRDNDFHYPQTFSKMMDLAIRRARVHDHFAGALARDKFMAMMDAVDRRRNEILAELNSLLEVSRLDAFKLIPLSSTLDDLEISEEETARLWGLPSSPLDARDDKEPPNTKARGK